MDVYIHPKNMIQWPWTYIYILTNAFFYLVVCEFLPWSLSGVVFFLPFFTILPLTNDKVKEKYAFVRTYIYIHGRWGSYYRKYIRNTAVVQLIPVIVLDDWKVENNESFSDHKYFSFSEGSFEQMKTELRHLNKANWNLFRESPDMVEWPVIGDGSSLNDLADKLEKLVEGAHEKACPKKPSSNKKINSWRDHELEESLQRVTNLRDWKDRTDFCFMK